MKEQKHPFMSEQKNSSHESWRSEKIETYKSKKLSRRDALKLGIGTGLLGYAALKALPVLRELGLFVPSREEPPAAPISPEEAEVIATQTAPTQEATSTSSSEATPEPTREPVVQREGEFAGINLYDSTTPIDMGVFLENRTIPVPAFTTVKFREGILDSEDFEPYMNTAIVWRDGDGHMHLEGHSGWYAVDTQRVGFTFTPWQLALEEKPAQGNPEQMVRVYPRIADETILDQFIGQEVLIRQGQVNSLVNIIAGVRVPPSRIPESKRNIANIVPWLATTFPNHGFEQVMEEDPWKVLVIKFCGRNLQGENLDASRQASGEYSSMRQARFFFVLKQA